MKQTQRIVKSGDYYELEVSDDILNYQKLMKKQQVPTSSNAVASVENIIVQLPSQQEARSSYRQPLSLATPADASLVDYQTQLEKLLSQEGVKDEEKLQIRKLLEEIDGIQNCRQQELNSLPTKDPYQVKEATNEPPKPIQLKHSYQVENLESQIGQLEKLGLQDIGKIECLVNILLGQTKTEPTGNSEIDERTKEEIESLYFHMKTLTCLHNIPSIIEKISSNQAKFVEMKEWTKNAEEVSIINKDLSQEFQHDNLLLTELENSFKNNISKVREIISKIKSE